MFDSVFHFSSPPMIIYHKKLTKSIFSVDI
nr:MAG TPA: hypothetical protein [Caudoviricetes sp.]DAE64882.1 MAG TPA: hypothetical protein [Caudoviricetes sp.]DAG15465.1 MAG TPA: hypothetical protein [Caudoviricetes sp.]DAN53532.1 MAG TPA: hypothetical protein [Caudoviricetes sp.]DAN74800.1 MAG TPA: hypothetical protein [Caudoviricetes sp.]